MTLAWRAPINTRCPLGIRQLEILRWLSLGKSADETAVIMGISTHTVNDYMGKAMRKAGMNKATGLVGMALREGWIQ